MASLESSGGVDGCFGSRTGHDQLISSIKLCEQRQSLRLPCFALSPSLLCLGSLENGDNAHLNEVERRQRELQSKQQQLLREQRSADQEKLLACITGLISLHSMHQKATPQSNLPDSKDERRYSTAGVEQEPEHFAKAHGSLSGAIQDFWD